MVIDITNIKKLKEFIFDGLGNFSDEYERCWKCWEDEEKYKCKDYDFCKRYTPNMIGLVNDNTKNLVEDLFDTLEELINRKD